MSKTPNQSRAPRIWWELCLFAFAFISAPTLRPFVSQVSWIDPSWIYLVAVGLPLVLLCLSFIFDISPTLVGRAEVSFQNRHAQDTYSIPVQFKIIKWIVPGFSRLRAIRTDTNETLSAWSLRMNHSLQVR